jgi:hypothetical protein
MKKFLAVSSMLLVLALVSFGQEEMLQIRVLFPGTQLATVNANPDPAGALPGPLHATANNRLYFSDASDSTNTEIFEVYSITAEVFAKVTDTQTLKAKVDQVNGSAPAPSVMTVQALSVDSSGHVIILTDGPAPETAYLFRVNPATKAVTVLSGLDGPAPGRSSIEGNSSMAVFDTTAYITLNDAFGAVRGDSIVQVETTSADGGATAATELVSAAQLQTAMKAKAEVIALNDIAVRPAAGTLVAINSGSPDSSDDLIEIDPFTGRVTLLVAATDIEADIGTTDVGFSAIEIGPNDVIVLANAFGTVGEHANRSIIAIRNAGNGGGDARPYAYEVEILAQAPVSQLGFVNGGLAIHPITGEVFFSETNPRGPAGHTNGVIGVLRTMGPPPPPPPYKQR